MTAHVPAQTVSLKTTEPARNAQPNAEPVQFPAAATPVQTSTETPTTTAHVSPDSTMPVSINAALATQVAPPVQAPHHAQAVMPENSEPSATLFASAKKDTSN